MKYIVKKSEPRSLGEYRSKANGAYGDIPTTTKDDIRKSLLEEQGYICCYCMRRIKEDDMRIEHWRPQSLYPQLEIDYNNMLGTCNGNIEEGGAKHLQCCDRSKGSTEITINPLHPVCEKLVIYRNDGRVDSEDEKINQELNEILNLNIQSIVNNRKSVIDEVINYLKRKYPNPDKQWTKAMIQRQIEKWNCRDSEGKHREYCQVAVFRLQKLYRKARI